MGHDFQKLQEYKDLKESLARVWAVVDYDGEVEIFESRELAEAAREDEEVQELMIRNARFCQLHKDLFLSEEKDLDSDQEEYDYDEECDSDDSDDSESWTPVFAPPAPKPTIADIQNKLRDLAKFKSALPQKQPASVVSARPAQTASAPAQAASALNNDGRLICYACGEPTKVVDTGFSKYSICTVCGK